jgi:hypothetical protein
MPKPTTSRKGSEPSGAGKLAQRFGGNAKGDRRRAVDVVSSANPAVLQDVVSAIIRDGDAIMFGSTSDGGALVVTLFSGDERKKFYPDDDSSFRAALAQIGDAYMNDSERAQRLVEKKKSG